MIHKIAGKHFIYGRFSKLMQYRVNSISWGGSSSLRVYLDTFILTYWTLLAFGWARWVNRVKVTRGCAMAWRPCRVSLSVLPSPFPLPACMPASLLVCLSVCLSHCALRTAPHTACGIFFFEFGSVRFFGAVSLWENVGLFGRFSTVCAVYFRFFSWFGSVRFFFLGRFAWVALWLIERIRFLRVENSAHPESECLYMRSCICMCLHMCVCVSLCAVSGKAHPPHS